MKRPYALTTPRLAVTFAGCFLGAGYVSGQELWHFFGSFGAAGLLGLLAAMLLLAMMGRVVLRLVRTTGEEDADKLIVFWDSPALRAIPGVVEIVFIFGTAVVMCAGVGALAEQLFAVPPAVSCAVFTVLIAALYLAGIRGMVDAFEISVPVLVLCAAALCAVSLVRSGLPPLAAHTSHEANPLLTHWFTSALVFASYNVFECVAILAPVAKLVPDEKTARRGVALGALALLFIALSVLFSILSDPASVETELPMLKMAADLHPYLGYVYAAALGLTLTSAALSSFVTSVRFAAKKLAKGPRGRACLLLLGAAAMYAGSLVGFNRLLGIVYPVYGYVTAVFVLLLAVHWVRIRRAARSA